MVGYHAGNEVNLMSGRLLDAVPLSSLTGVGAAQSSKLAKIGLCVTKIAPIFTR